MVRHEWPYAAAREQTLSDEGDGRKLAKEQVLKRTLTRTGPQKYRTAAPAESGRGILRKGEMQSENQSPVAAFLFFVERLP